LEIEQSALRALPATPFEYAAWKKARVNLDYHVVLDDHLYSVAYQYVHDEV